MLSNRNPFFYERNTNVLSTHTKDWVRTKERVENQSHVQNPMGRNACHGYRISSVFSLYIRLGSPLFFLSLSSSLCIFLFTNRSLILDIARAQNDHICSSMGVPASVIFEGKFSSNSMCAIPKTHGRKVLLLAVRLRRRVGASSSPRGPVRRVGTGPARLGRREAHLLVPSPRTGEGIGMLCGGRSAPARRTANGRGARGGGTRKGAGRVGRRVGVRDPNEAKRKKQKERSLHCL